MNMDREQYEATKAAMREGGDNLLSIEYIRNIKDPEYMRQYNRFVAEDMTPPFLENLTEVEKSVKQLMFELECINDMNPLMAKTLKILLTENINKLIK